MAFPQSPVLLYLALQCDVNATPRARATGTCIIQHMSSRPHLTFLYTMHLRIVVLQLQLQPQLTVPS
jgi:hypothetical protein